MVKICPKCVVAWAGGFRCEVCGGPLVGPADPAARDLPPGIWRDIKVDYGARRGMIFRFLGIFAGAFTALMGVRASIIQPSPWSWIGAALSIAAGITLWRLMYHGAERVVRLFILRRGQLKRGKLARALIRQAVAGPRRGG